MLLDTSITEDKGQEVCQTSWTAFVVPHLLSGGEQACSV